MDKSQAVWEYISKYPGIPGALTFNSIVDLQNSTGLIPVSAESNIQSYADGSMKKEYAFAIVKMSMYDTGTGDTNILSLAEMQKFMDWIVEQNVAGNFPDFGSDCLIDSIEPLQNIPSLAGTSESNMTAKYMFQCRIVYYQEGKTHG